MWSYKNIIYILYITLGVFDSSHKQGRRTKITTAADLSPIEKQIGLLGTKVNLALSKFGALPFKSDGIVKEIIDISNKKIV